MNHGGSALEKADPCPDMDCATTNGSGSRICCQGGSGMLASPLKTTADSSRRSSIATVPEFRGVTSRNASVTGKTFTEGSAAGRKTGGWERVFEHLASEADNEYAMLDSTI